MFTTILILALSTGDVLRFEHNKTFDSERECRAAVPAMDRKAEALLAKRYGKGQRGHLYEFQIKCQPVQAADTI
ncbi:hypothetical protein JQ608_06845 [Bradyrhizobium liaoningense]|uniref:hypothetical protein n=1 Tax=Bradyrhizobium liaoningense TaxID=43992 RepID=UPI001BAD2754|nr:hypothetical protein [Bradyrhizobium liaoningense]MBR0876919.1 hypothetical protein [Bradyrhizobium liaoningense]